MTLRMGRSPRSWQSRALQAALALMAVSWLGHASAMEETAPHRRPVKTIAPERLKIKAALGDALVPAYFSTDVTKVQPQIKRAVIVVHGRLRDADKYFDLSMRAAKSSNALSDTVIIAPQILTSGDSARHDLAANVARWKSDTWVGGDAGKAPFAISSFEVIDGIIAVLSDRTRFPHLERIVIAAHSGGAQFIQRYAVVGRADQVLTAAGLQPYADGVEPSAGTNNVMRVRYVVANPSSYVYFDSGRPKPVERCAEFNHWRYGMVDPVPYVRGDNKALEQRYLTRRVVYLAGGNDVDPNHSALDKSCMGEAQGANRLERSVNYFSHVQKRAKVQGVTLRHTRVEVPGIAHDADRMFNSACGMAAIFDLPGCELKLGDSFVALISPPLAASPATGTGTGPAPLTGQGSPTGSVPTRHSLAKP